MHLLVDARRAAALATVAAVLAAPAAGAQEADIFLRGDTTLDGSVNVTDAIVILNCQFYAIGCISACEDSGDADDSGAINLTDAVFLLRALFLGEGVVPPPGLAECGPDPTRDVMVACTYQSCPP